MHWFLRIGIGGLLTGATALAAVDQQAALVRFEQDYPAARVYRDGTRITRVYGPAFGFGTSPEDTAASFVKEYSALLGVDAADLVPGNRFNDQLTQPVMYDRQTGRYKSTLVYYTQYKDGVPVYQADVRFLTRNERAHALVLVASSLRNLGSFSVPAGALQVEPGALGHESALALVPDLVDFSSSEYVIWAGVDRMVVEPKLAVKFIADNGLPATTEYEKWLFIADAATGEILHREDLIVHVDVFGNVSGMATTLPKADVCNPEVLTPMPYAQVSIGATSAYADETGDFVIPHDGSSEVTVTSRIRGLYFRVNNQGGSDEVLTEQVIPPGPANFVHNEDNSFEKVRAQVNGYVQANLVRDFALAQNPEYPTIHDQYDWPVNVNINDNCNAYYDYSSINFYTSGGGCSNTAFSTVVHHEYGHHLVAVGGSGQGQYGEGMGDCIGMLITDDPVLAYGFYSSDCSQGLRTGDNDYQYPCSGGIHDCGQLLSGCVWSTRNELLATNPDTYLEIISTLTVNSILLHSGTMITPQITIDFLTLDDDDDDISNGTPHYYEIAAGFGAHNMPAPELSLLAFSFPDGRPELINPAGGTTVRVEVSALTEDPEPGTGMFYYDTGSGYDAVPMDVVSPNVYDAVFPPVTCGQGVKYYFSAETTDGQVVYNPSDAPAGTYSTISGYGLIVAFEDDFESDQGWTVYAGAVTGNWERGDPEQTTVGWWDPLVAQPENDHSPDGTLCFVTDPRAGSSAGDYDVDEGPTHLFSPVLDLESTDAIVSYWRWYHISTEWDDELVVAVSNDGGSTWVTVETVNDREEWTHVEWRVGDYVEPTAQVQIRFTADDSPNNSLVEALVDDVRIESVDCTPDFGLGDLNCDGAVDGFDIDPFVLALTSAPSFDDYYAQYPDCDAMLADCNGDGVVDGFDIDPFVALLSG